MACYAQSMHIYNMMLGKGHGGLEQAALDYAEALALAGHRVTQIMAPDGWAASQALPGATPYLLKQCGEWDVLAKHRLRKKIRAEKPDALIAHGNRAIGIGLGSGKGLLPVIGVAHNYKIKRFAKLDGCIGITQDLCETLANQGIAREVIFTIPNLVRPGEPPRRSAFRAPPVIGAMGRFVHKKGFDVFLQALSKLKKAHIPFRALLAGRGEEYAALQNMAKQLDLETELQFVGWVEREHKQLFFDQLDLFVLPSRHEPFGIVLLEAMAAGLPCITSASEGPCEIITEGQDAWMVGVGRPEELAAAMAEALHDQAEAIALGRRAYETVSSRYSLATISGRIDKMLQKVLSHG